MIPKVWTEGRKEGRGTKKKKVPYHRLETFDVSVKL
jgi:hypothetical protein